MGKTGPKPMPRALLALHNSRHLDDRVDEPKPAAADLGAPYRPRWLASRKYAAETWERVVPILSRIPGLLSHLDLEVLSSYCEAVSQWRECGDWVAKNGMLVTRTIYNKQGEAVGEEVSEHPLASRQLKLWDKMMALSAKIGLSPADRAGLARSVRPPAKPTPKDEHAAAIERLFGSA